MEAVAGVKRESREKGRLDRREKSGAEQGRGNAQKSVARRRTAQQAGLIARHLVRTRLVRKLGAWNVKLARGRGGKTGVEGDGAAGELPGRVECRGVGEGEFAAAKEAEECGGEGSRQDNGVGVAWVEGMHQLGEDGVRDGESRADVEVAVGAGNTTQDEG
ncbi:hypothetical protein HDU67_006396 [Dinochytrium kinnereticum]|nr:hypothetical protein HDU67_006396 [Dinochytrium kinnereticum]